MADAFTSGQAARLAGLSYRMLDHWVRTGAVAPSIEEGHGSGYRRLWSARDLSALAAVATVARDFSALGAQPSHDLVHRLWVALSSSSSAALRSGSVTVTVRRPTVDLDQLALFEEVV